MILKIIKWSTIAISGPSECPACEEMTYENDHCSYCGYGAA